MNKLAGTLLVFLGVFLILVAVLSVLANILPSIEVAFETGAAYAWGRLAGSLIITILFFLLGLKAFKAGRRRFAAEQPASASNA